MFVATLLARAESVDPTLDNLVTIVTCAGIVLGVAVIASIPVLVAWSRRHRRADWVITLAIVWAAIATVSLASTVLAEMKYSHQHMLDVQSGYLNPNDMTDAPELPVVLWAILAFGYACLLAWPMLRRPEGSADRLSVE